MLGKIKDLSFSILINPRVTKYFFSHTTLSKLKIKEIDQEDFNQVEKVLGVKHEVACLVKDYKIDLYVCVA